MTNVSRDGRGAWDPLATPDPELESTPVPKREGGASRKAKAPSRSRRDASERDARSGGSPRPPFRRPGAAAQAKRAGISFAGDERLVLFGSHAVEAALRNPARVVHKAWMTENAERRLGPALAARKLTIERVRPRDLDLKLGADTVHQGVALEADPLPDVELGFLITKAADGPIVLLDQVTDPHNVGAVLRSAAAFGAVGVVMTRRHSPPLGGALAKAASGALDQVPIALVQNLARALGELAAAGIRVVGLDGAAETALEAADLAGPTAIVLGAEGRGLRELTRERCSLLVRVSTSGTLASLNVSNAAAIALHFAAFRRRGERVQG